MRLRTLLAMNRRSLPAIIAFAAATVALGLSAPGVATAQEGGGDIGKKSSNPLSDIWSLKNEVDFIPIEGGDFTQAESQLTYIFQPVMPLPLGDTFSLIVRPTFTYNEVPFINDLGLVDYAAGLGDTTVLSLVAPTQSDGFTWGLGASFVLPTATHKRTGTGLWQGGPAAVGILSGKSSLFGFLFQHGESLGGTDNLRQATRSSSLQLIYWYFLKPGLAMGGTPTSTIDWTKDERNRYSIPLGIAVNYTTSIRKLPVKLVLEYDFFIKRPDDLASPESMLRMTITPIIPSPFK